MEEYSRKLDEYHALLAVNKERLANEHSSEIGNDNYCAERKDYPNGGNDSRLFNHAGLLYRHKANENVRHTEVAKSPCKSVCNIRRCCSKEICNELISCISRNDYVRKNGSIKILCYNYYYRHRKHRNEHKNSLEEIRPANCLVATKECVDYKYRCKDYHCNSRLNIREKCCKYVCSRNESRSNVNGKANKEYCRANDLKCLVLRHKTVCKILRKRNGVVCRL